MAKDPSLTTSAGNPAVDHQNAMTSGPIVLQSQPFIAGNNPPKSS